MLDPSSGFQASGCQAITNSPGWKHTACAEQCYIAQVASISTEVQQQVGGAVQAALAQALPQQLAGPHLKAALESSLGSQLQQALARPLQTSFTTAFQHQLMPAFEGACRDMFAQVSLGFTLLPCVVPRRLVVRHTCVCVGDTSWACAYVESRTVLLFLSLRCQHVIDVGFVEVKS